MFEYGDRVIYKRTGEELIVRASHRRSGWTGGGFCLFKDKKFFGAGWAHLKLVKLENV